MSVQPYKLFQWGNLVMCLILFVYILRPLQTCNYDCNIFEKKNLVNLSAGLLTVVPYPLADLGGGAPGARPPICLAS